MSDMNSFDPNSQPNGDNTQPGGDYGQPNGGNTQPGSDYSQQSYGYSGVPVQEEKKGMSIASLVLGICGFLAWCIPLFGYPVTIVGIIMGVLGMKKGGKGMAIAGIICSVISLILTIINSVAGAALAVNGFAGF